MASGGQEILRSYLFSLGFKVDQVQTSKFDKQLVNFEKTALRLGGALVGVATAAQAMVGVFANQMEKLYYASKRTGATVGNIQALEYGAKQIGLQGGVITQSLEGMARALRANPGLTGLLSSLGVRVEGRDKSDVLKDLVTQLGKMPFYVAQQYASMFGIDPDTLLMLEQGREELERAAAARKEMASAAGVDAEAAAKASKEYMNLLRETQERFGLLKDAAAIALLPAAHKFAGVINEVLKDWTHIATSIGKAKGGDGFWARLVEGITGTQTRGNGYATGGVKLSADAQARLRTMPGGLPATGAGGGRGGINPPTVTGSQSGLLESLEKLYGLPPGLLDRMWKQESGRGQHMLSPAGAQGHFGFMPKTASAYGVTDPNDFGQSASGAARMMADLLKQYGGDLPKALAGYNWGSGNVAKYGMGGLPKETLGYIRDVGGVNLKQENNFNIYGTGDAAGTAKLVSRDMDRVNGDLTRNMKGALQ